MRVAISGAAGNLGGKLINFLQSAPWCTSILGIDPRPLVDDGKFRGIVADLRDPHDRLWIDAVESADAIVHFAAESPAPDSTWPQAALSLDMTLNLLHRVGAHRPCRFVFASSNHVMGGYKDAPLPAGEALGSTTPPRPGTRFFNGIEFQHPSAYGASKLMGERAVAARAATSQLTGVNIRIGWVQPGANLPETLGPHGGGRRIGSDDPDATELERANAWYRGVWMSNRDFLQLMEKALTSSSDAWPTRSVVVSGVSNNTGTAWNLDEVRRWIGYRPLDGIAAR